MRHCPAPRPAGSRPQRTALALAALVPLLAACQSAGDTTGSIYPADYRDRHPIVLADGARSLDVFVGGPGGLVSRERQDVATFLDEWQRTGTGPVVAQVPVGFGTNPDTQRALARLRETVGGRMTVSHYRPTDPQMASPIRLSFRRLQAKVGSQCGLWPQDLGPTDIGFSWRNQEYWNLGCATRQNMAAQIADPVDLVRGRTETPPDIGRRMYNFGQMRAGNDPSTQWRAGDATTSSLAAGGGGTR